MVGSHAMATRSLLSDYYGDEVCFGAPTGSPKTADGCITTIGASVTATNARHGGETKVIAGVGVTQAANATAMAAALAAVAWSDVTVLALGLNHGLEHEGMDRHNTELPAAQLDFALRVLAAGKPVVLLMVNGGIVSIDDLLHPPSVFGGASDMPTSTCTLFKLQMVRARACARLSQNGDAAAVVSAASF